MLPFLFFLSILGYGFAIKKTGKNIGLGSALLGGFCLQVLAAYISVFLLSSYTIAPFALLGGGLFLLLLSPLAKSTWKTIWQADRAVLLAYLLCSALFVALLQGTQLWVPDEYNFWGRAVAELHAFRSSYFNPFTNMRHRDYLPAYIPLQYSLVRVFGWSEHALYYPNVAGLFTALLAAVETVGPRRKAVYFLFPLANIFLLPLADRTFAYNSLNVDSQLAILFSCALLLVFFSAPKAKSHLVIAALCGVLTLLKVYTGILFAAVVLLGMVFRRFAGKELSARALFAALLAVLFVQISWSGFYQYNMMRVEYQAGAARQQMFGIENTAPTPTVTPGGLLSSNPRSGQIQKVLKRGLPEEFYTFSKTALQRLWQEPLFSSGKISAAGWTAALLVFFALTALLLRRQKGLGPAFWFLVSGLFVYLAGIFFTYSFQDETIGSLPRYYAVIVTCLTVFLLFALCLLWEKHGPFWRPVALALAFFLAVLTFFDMGFWLHYTQKQHRGTQDHYALQMVAQLQNSFNPAAGNSILVLGTTRGDLALSDSTNARMEHFFIPHRASVLVRKEPQFADAMVYEWFAHQVQSHLAKRIVVLVESDAYKHQIAKTMGIPADTPMPWIFDVKNENSRLQFVLQSNT